MDIEGQQRQGQQEQYRAARAEGLVLLALIATISAAGLYMPPAGYFSSSGPLTDGSYYIPGEKENPSWRERAIKCSAHATLGVAVAECHTLFMYHSICLYGAFIVSSAGIMFIYVLGLIPSRVANIVCSVVLMVSFNFLAFSTLILHFVQMGNPHIDSAISKTIWGFGSFWVGVNIFILTLWVGDCMGNKRLRGVRHFFGGEQPN